MLVNAIQIEPPFHVRASLFRPYAMPGRQDVHPVSPQAQGIRHVLAMEIVGSRVVRRIKVVEDQDFHAISNTGIRLATKRHNNARKNSALFSAVFVPLCGDSPRLLSLDRQQPMLEDRVESVMFRNAQGSVRFAVSTIFVLSLCASAFGASSPESIGMASQLPLAETERVYIAKIETRGLMLNQKGFPALARALRTGEVQQVQFFFSESFKGELLAFPENPNHQSDILQIRRATSAAKPLPGKFVENLVEWRKRFAKDAKVEIALMSLSPLSRAELETGGWKGNCALRIVGPRATAGEGKGELMVKFDFELGKLPDVDEIASTAGWIRSLRMTEGQQGIARHDLMAEVGKEWGVDRTLFLDNWTSTIPPGQRPIVTGSVHVGDLDNDGHDDLLVPDLNGTFLFRATENGKFKEVSRQSGLPVELRNPATAALGDFDNDGLVDVLLDVRSFKNLGNFRFQEVTDRTDFRFGTATGVSVGDFDRDGKLDLYISRSHGPKAPRGGKNSWIDGPGGPGNQLWRNLGNWKFEEVSHKVNAQAGRRSAFTACWLDVNNDGAPDIYVINEFGGGTLLVNHGNGTFREMPLVNDAGDFGSMGMVVGDYNNDGNIDIYTANMYSKAGRRIMENLAPESYPPDVFTKMKRFVTGSEMYRNNGDLKFERIGKTLRVHAVGWAYGTCLVDLDNDGFLDLYGTAGFVSVNKEEPDG
jgi:hypothetical protein